MSTTVREEHEVGDLDPTAVLEAAAEAEQTERRAAFRKLALAAHWADLHPATIYTGVETAGGAALLRTSHSAGTAPRPWPRSPPSRSPWPWACPRRPAHS